MKTHDTIALRIPRGGVISGNVVDEFGDAAFGVPVRALRLSFMMNGERTANSAGQAVTDDLGGYRLAGLLPGEYVVKVGVFTPGWGKLYDWNDAAAKLIVAR